MCMSCKFLALVALVAIISGTAGYASHPNTFIVTVEPGIRQ